MFGFLVASGGAFMAGGVIGFVIAAMLAATRHAELRDLWDKASRDAGRAERQLMRLRARCQREFGATWLDPPKIAR